jgi:hypothetical protein
MPHSSWWIIKSFQGSCYCYTTRILSNEVWKRVVVRCYDIYIIVFCCDPPKNFNCFLLLFQNIYCKFLWWRYTMNRLITEKLMVFYNCYFRLGNTNCNFYTYRYCNCSVKMFVTYFVTNESEIRIEYVNCLIDPTRDWCMQSK